MTGAHDPLFLGADIGGSSVETVVTDAEHRVVARDLEPTDASSARAVVAGVITVIRRTLTDAGEGVAGIGIGVPGQVDAAGGLVRFAMNLGIGEDGLALGPEVAEALGLEVAVENDVQAAALGAYELFRPEVQDLHRLVYLSIGTGISAGVIEDGRLHRDSQGLAGEIGHVVVAPDGPVCRCGLRGCLEAVAAGPAIARMWPSADGRNAEDLFRAAAGGRPEARAMVHDLTVRLTEAVQWLAIAHGADLVALGGGVGSIGGPLLEAIRVRLGGFAEMSPLARRLVPAERVRAVPPGHPTGAIGAAAVARERLAASERGGEEAMSPGTR